MPHHNLNLLGSFKGKPKTQHTADAMIIHCMDFRFQDPFKEFEKRQNFPNGCDHVVLAGGVKDAKEVDKHVDLGVGLHNIKKILLVNHRTCGVYGPDLAKDPEKELDKHIADLTKTAVRLQKKYHKLKIQTLFADIKDPQNGSSRVEILEVDWKSELT
jgi:carbonic anhydrase